LIPHALHIPNLREGRRRCTFEWVEASYLEMQLYNMRHVQEHAAQLGFWLGQQGVTGFDWVAKARGSAVER
jgi:hypothetical protein